MIYLTAALPHGGASERSDTAGAADTGADDAAGAADAPPLGPHFHATDDEAAFSLSGDE